MTYIPNITKNLSLLVVPLLCLNMGARDARAQKVESITIYQADNSEVIASSTSTSDGIKDEYFNLARCQCSEPGDDTDIRIRLRFNDWSASDDTLVAVVVGTGTCLDTDNSKSELDPDCTTILGEAGQFKKIKELSAEFDIYTKTMKMMGGDCLEDNDEISMNIYVFIDETKTQESWQSQATIQYTVDSEPPLVPKVSEPVAGEELVEITITQPTTSAVPDGGTSATDPSIRGYQVLCQIAATGKGIANPPAPEYVSPINLCGLTPEATAQDGGTDGPVDATVPDVQSPDQALPDMALPDTALPDMATTVSDAVAPDVTKIDTAQDTPVDLALSREAAPRDAGVEAATVQESTEILDKSFVCSELSNSPGTIRINGLTNGVEYNFYVVTIDQLRNPSEPVSAGSATPEPAEDLWERYKRSGGTAQGGYCSLIGDMPAWPAAPLLLLGLALITRRLRKTRRPPRAGGRP